MSDFNNVVRLMVAVEEGLASGTMSQDEAVNTLTSLRKTVTHFIGTGVLTEAGESMAINIVEEVAVIMMMIDEEN